jgi:hypothetical protein
MQGKDEEDEDMTFKTGFEIDISREMSELESMLEDRLYRMRGEDSRDNSLIFCRLKQKIGLL